MLPRLAAAAACWSPLHDATLAGATIGPRRRVGRQWSHVARRPRQSSGAQTQQRFSQAPRRRQCRRRRLTDCCCSLRCSCSLPGTTPALAPFRSALSLYLQGTKVCRYKWHSAGSPGRPVPRLKYKCIFFYKIYTAAISSHSTRKLLWFEIAKMPIQFQK